MGICQRPSGIASYGGLVDGIMYFTISNHVGIISHHNKTFGIITGDYIGGVTEFIIINDINKITGVEY